MLICWWLFLLVIGTVVRMRLLTGVWEAQTLLQAQQIFLPFKTWWKDQQVDWLGKCSDGTLTFSLSVREEQRIQPQLAHLLHELCNLFGTSGHVGNQNEGHECQMYQLLLSTKMSLSLNEKVVMCSIPQKLFSPGIYPTNNITALRRQMFILRSGQCWPE